MALFLKNTINPSKGFLRQLEEICCQRASVPLQKQTISTRTGTVSKQYEIST